MDFKVIWSDAAIADLHDIFYDVSEENRSIEILHVWHGAREEPTF